MIVIPLTGAVLIGASGIFVVGAIFGFLLSRSMK